MFAGLDVCINTAAPTSQHLYTYIACLFFLAIDCELGGKEKKKKKKKKNETINQSSPASCVCVQVVTQRSGEELRKMQK
jgi:hypothetical protein